MEHPQPNLEIAFAEFSTLLKTVVSDVADVKSRLSVMNEQFARKSDLESQGIAMDSLKEKISDLKTALAVTATKIATWGVVGGIIITLLAAAISTLQIHL